MKSKFLVILAFSIALVPLSSSAANYNKNFVISDNDMTDYSRMTESSVQTMLDKYGGLSTYRTTDIDGVERSAAEIIYRSAYRNRLNPQFLLAHLQKESSLVSRYNANLIDWAMGYGVCDGCSKSHPNVIKYKGFAKQIDAAALGFRGYLADLKANGTTVSGWGVGITKNSLDGVAITPGNEATAALFTYTPWNGYHGGDASIGGNSLFFDIMERYFPNRSGLVLNYPNSSLFQDVDSGSVYKLDNDKLRPITSYVVLAANYDLSRIIPVDDTVLSRYEYGSDISYPKFILLQNQDNGGVYLIDQNHERRAITSRELFRSLGYNPEEMIPVATADLDAIPEGAPITAADKYPVGALIQNSSTGAVMFIDSESTLHPIIAKEIMENQYKGYSVIQESASVFENNKVDEPVIFSDGTLLKIPERDTIYVVSNGKKRAVESEEVLDSLGGYGNVVTTSKSVLKLHKTGNPLNFKKNKNSTDKKSKKSKKNKKKTSNKK